MLTREIQTVNQSGELDRADPTRKANAAIMILGVTR